MAAHNDPWHQAYDRSESGSVNVHFDEDVSVIKLAGEVDLAMSEVLEDASREVLERGMPVEVDASRLNFIDSSGLGFLTRMIQVRPGGKPPRVRGASPLIHDTLRICGLLDLIELD